MKFLLLFFLFHWTQSWISGYKRRQVFSIKNDSMIDESDLDVEVKIDTKTFVGSSKMRKDCFDAIFTFTNDDVLDFWLEGGCNTASTVFWVRIPQIDSREELVLYMYFDSSDVLSFQGELWDSNRLGFFSDKECSGSISTEWIETYDILVKGSSTQNTFQGSEHEHALPGYCFSTESYGINYQESSVGDTLAHDFHTHEIHLDNDASPVAAFPPSRKYAVCYGNTDNRLSGLVPVGAIGFFDHTNPIDGWDSGSVHLNSNEEYLMGGNSSEINMTHGSATHSHPVDMSGCTVQPAVGGSQATNSEATSGSEVSWSEPLHSHSFQPCSTNETITEPPFHYLNARRASSNTSLPGGIITFEYCTAACSAPPFGWEDYSDLNDYFIRGTNNSNDVGTFGGRVNHYHSVHCYTGGDTSSSHHFDDDVGGGALTYDTDHIHAYNGTIHVGVNDPPHTRIRFLQRKMSNFTMSLFDEEFLCFSEISSSGNTCSLHGNCTDFDVCTCWENYYGSSCNVTSCDGVYSNETSEVCSGQGTCQDFERCSCEDDYFGEYCNITTCRGIFSNETEACSVHGFCTSFEKCECENNYFGEDCNITRCGDIFSNDTKAVCSESGKCVDYEKCECYTDIFYGENCNITKCQGRLSNVTSTCTEYGTCWPFGVCHCDSGYFGESCNVTTCFGEYSNNSDIVCSEHGDCWPENVCVCDVASGSAGSDCQEYWVGFPDDVLLKRSRYVWFFSLRVLASEFTIVDEQECNITDLFANHEDLFGTGSEHVECKWVVSDEDVSDDERRAVLNTKVVTDGFEVKLRDEFPVLSNKDIYTVQALSLSDPDRPPLEFDVSGTGPADDTSQEENDDDDSGSGSVGGIVGGILGGVGGAIIVGLLFCVLGLAICLILILCLLLVCGMILGGVGGAGGYLYHKKQEKEEEEVLDEAVQELEEEEEEEEKKKKKKKRKKKRKKKKKEKIYDEEELKEDVVNDLVKLDEITDGVDEEKNI